RPRAGIPVVMPIILVYGADRNRFAHERTTGPRLYLNDRRRAGRDGGGTAQHIELNGQDASLIDHHRRCAKVANESDRRIEAFESKARHDHGLGGGAAVAIAIIKSPGHERRPLGGDWKCRGRRAGHSAGAVISGGWGRQCYGRRATAGYGRERWHRRRNGIL